MDPYNILIQILVNAIPVIFAITLHEAAHGYVAKAFGDSTAYMLGRVTLNPVKHIDPVGTLLLPAITVALAGVLFGWAKPVPVNFANLRNPRLHSIWVAAAGPGSNVLQALIWALVAKILAENVSPTGLAGAFWFAVAQAGVVWNVIFAILNLFPLLPLDGGRIVASLLPPRLSYAYSRTEPFGLLILLALVMIPGVFSTIFYPLVTASVESLYAMFGLK